MPLLYSVVARSMTVLARYAICAGNFAEVTEQILGKINTNEASKLTYSHASYLFHYITEAGIIYLCITDDVSYYILFIFIYSVLLYILRIFRVLF